MNLSAFHPPSAPVILASVWLVGSASATAENAKRQSEMAKVLTFVKQDFCGVFVGVWQASNNALLQSVFSFDLGASLLSSIVVQPVEKDGFSRFVKIQLRLHAFQRKFLHMPIHKRKVHVITITTVAL